MAQSLEAGRQLGRSSILCDSRVRSPKAAPGNSGAELSLGSLDKAGGPWLHLERLRLSPIRMRQIQGRDTKCIPPWMKLSPDSLTQTCLEHHFTNNAGGQVTYLFNREQRFKSIRPCSELAISQKVHDSGRECLRHDKYFLKRLSSFQNLHTTV